MAKQKHSPCISVSAAMYARITAAAQRFGVSRADLVRESCADILAPEQPASR